MILISLLISITAQANSDVVASNDITINKQSGISFSQQWGLDAINIPQSLVSHNAESLGLLAPEENLFATSRIVTRTGQWKSNDKSSSKYWVGHIQQPTVNDDVNKRPFVSDIRENHGLNAAYVFGRFSAETAIINQQSTIADSTTIYLQGAYNIVAYENLNVTVTAQFESMGENQVRGYFGAPEYDVLTVSSNTKRAKNYTLGLVTTYSITKDWKLMGLLSATNLDKTLEKSPFIDHKNIQMALIGTSYSF